MSDPQSIPSASPGDAASAAHRDALAVAAADRLALRIFEHTSALPPDEREWVTARLRQSAAERSLLDDPTVDVARTPEAEAARQAATQRSREVGRRGREESPETRARRASERELHRRASLELGDAYALRHGRSPSTRSWDDMLEQLPEEDKPPFKLGHSTVIRLWGSWSAFEDALGQRFNLAGRGLLLRSSPGKYPDHILREGIELAIREELVFDITAPHCVEVMRAANRESLKQGEPERFPNSQNPFFRESGATFYLLRAQVQAMLAEEGLLPPMRSRKRGPSMPVAAAWEEWERKQGADLSSLERAAERHDRSPDQQVDPACLDLGPIPPETGEVPRELLLELLRDAQAREARTTGISTEELTLSKRAYRRIRRDLVAEAAAAHIRLRSCSEEYVEQRFGSFDAALQAAGLPHRPFRTGTLTDDQVLDTVLLALRAGKGRSRYTLEEWREDEVRDHPERRLATWQTITKRLGASRMVGVVAELRRRRPEHADELDRLLAPGGQDARQGAGS